MDYQFTADLLTDILFRTNAESTGDFDAAALRYLNRAYFAVCGGGQEFSPDLHEEWLWLKSQPPGVLTLLPEVTTGTVTVTNNSAAMTFSSAPAVSVAGYHFKVATHADIFRVSAHVATSISATLDGVYTGPSGSGLTYGLRKYEYALATDLWRLMSPMRGARWTLDPVTPFRVHGMDLEGLEDQWPMAEWWGGPPDSYALLTETQVRFNRCPINGELVHLEYDYLRFPPVLTSPGTTEEPLVPRRWRAVLSDLATYLIHVDKNDSRADAAGLLGKAGLLAMARENRHRLVSLGATFGVIRPREDHRGWLGRRGVLRTESGLLIG